MKNNFDYLILDAGNTNIKIALFLNDNLAKLIIFKNIQDVQNNYFLNSIKFKKGIISSVRSKKDTLFLKKTFLNSLLLNECKIPLEINYKSIISLGKDRIANVVAIKNKCNTPALSIDIGTCIKFDFVDENGIYQGGSISPGINLRYKAMNDYTAALPYFIKKNKIELLGTNTKDCMQSGVINGIQGEINYFISNYSEKYPNLTIFMTGGDAKYFDYSLKNNIFAVENLTIEGLFLILKANAS
jgi:type III pantothenate kinase